jgi:hypothetical protein
MASMRAALAASRASFRATRNAVPLNLDAAVDVEVLPAALDLPFRVSDRVTRMPHSSQPAM